jgi:hypothetical protein
LSGWTEICTPLKLLAKITKARLLGEAYFCGVSWLFSWWKSIQLGFGLIILGEISRKYAILFM